MSVNKDHIRLWVEALRSGKYKQGTSHLNNNGKYCCLGVACEVARIPKQRSHRSLPYVYDECAQVPPPSLCDWLGLPPHSLFVQALVNMNDNQGKTFNEIADYLERELLGNG